MSVLLCNHVQLRIITKILNHGAPGPVIFLLMLMKEVFYVYHGKAEFSTANFFICVCALFLLVF